MPLWIAAHSSLLTVPTKFKVCDIYTCTCTLYMCTQEGVALRGFINKALHEAGQKHGAPLIKPGAAPCYDALTRTLLWCHNTCHNDLVGGHYGTPEEVRYDH